MRILKNFCIFVKIGINLINIRNFKKIWMKKDIKN